MVLFVEARRIFTMDFYGYTKKTTMIKWSYKNKTNFQIPKGTFGFIYKIEYVGEDTDDLKKGRFYIGKKALEFSKKKRLTIKEKQLPENKRKRFKINTKESDWETYQGSSFNLQKDIDKYGEESFTKSIICFCPDKINLTYKEMQWQFIYDVLIRDTWNISIGGKFFKGRIK